MGPPTWAQRGPTHLSPAWAHPDAAGAAGAGAGWCAEKRVFIDIPKTLFFGRGRSRADFDRSPAPPSGAGRSAEWPRKIDAREEHHKLLKTLN